MFKFDSERRVSHHQNFVITDRHHPMWALVLISTENNFSSTLLSILKTREILTMS